MREEKKGILFVLAAAVLYSIGGLCIKLIPWSGLSINAGRCALAMIVLGTYMALIHNKLRLNRWIFLGAVGACGANALFAVANKMTTAANAIVLQFTAPIFVILFGLIFFHKKPKKRELYACAAVFGGIIFVFLDGLEVGGMMGNVIALISGIAYAMVFLLNDLADGNPLSSIFWGYALSVIIGLPSLMAETVVSPGILTTLVILGVFQVAVAHICLCTGLKMTPPVTASLVSGIEPVLNPILVAVFYGETIGIFALIGAVIVIGSVVAYNVLEAKQ